MKFNALTFLVACMQCIDIPTHLCTITYKFYACQRFYAQYQQLIITIPLNR